MGTRSTVLRLEFLKEPSLVLEKTFFECPESQSASETTRNSLDGPSFQWGKTPAAFSLLILDYLFWSASRDPRAFSFSGLGSGGAPGTLYWLVRDKDGWLAKVFGTSKRKTQLLYDVLERNPRSSKKGAAPPHVSITVNLAPTVIHVMLGGRKLETELEIRDLWEKIKRRSSSFWDEEVQLAVERQQQHPIPTDLPEDSSPRDEATLGAGGRTEDDARIQQLQEIPRAIPNAEEPSASERPRKVRLWSIGLMALLAIFTALIAFQKDAGDNWEATVTPEEKQRIKELAFAFGHNEREAFEALSELQQRLLVKELASVTSFAYNKVTYSVTLVYKGTLSPSPFFMRYDHANGSLIVDNATIAFDKEQTLLMPVESFPNDAPNKKSHHGSLAKMKGLLQDHVLKSAEDAHLLLDVKAEFAAYCQEVLAKELKPALASGVKIKVVLP